MAQVATANAEIGVRPYAEACLVGLWTGTFVAAAMTGVPFSGPVCLLGLLAITLLHLADSRDLSQFAVAAGGLVVVGGVARLGSSVAIGTTIAVVVVLQGRRIIRTPGALRNVLTNSLLYAHVALGIYLAIIAIAPNWVISVSLLKDQETDLPFALTLVELIKNYGRPSVGLNGLLPLNYHWGSHAITAALSLYFKLPGGLVFAAAPLIVLPSLMVVVGRIVEIAARRTDAPGTPARLSRVFAWAMLPFASCILVPWLIVEQNNYVRDPSILWSLFSAACCVLALIVTAADGRRAAARAAPAALAILMGAVTILTKVSTFAVLLMVVAVGCVLLYRRIVIAIACMAAGIVFAVGYVWYLNQTRPEGAIARLPSLRFANPYFLDKAAPVVGSSTWLVVLTVWLKDFAWGALALIALPRYGTRTWKVVVGAACMLCGLTMFGFGLMWQPGLPNFSFIEPVRWVTFVLFVLVVGGSMTPAASVGTTWRRAVAFASGIGLAGILLRLAADDGRALEKWLRGQSASPNTVLSEVVAAVPTGPDVRTSALFLDDSFKDFLTSGAYGRFNCRTTPLILQASTGLFLVNGIFPDCAHFQGIGTYGHLSFQNVAGLHHYDFSCQTAEHFSVRRLVGVSYSGGHGVVRRLECGR